MNFSELVKKRYSCRQYQDKKVDREIVEQCIEAARLAPSACNSQPWHFVILDEENIKSEVASMTSGKMLPLNHFVHRAPIIVVALSHKGNMRTKIGGVIKNKAFYQYDVAMAVEHLCLKATELGLGTCILGWFREHAIKKAIKVPRGYKIELLVTLGYPADEVREKVRRVLSEIISFNIFDKT